MTAASCRGGPLPAPVPLDADPPWDTHLQGTQTELPERADVVVVGASVAGWTAARRLHEEGTDVLLLDANSPTGDGADRRGNRLAFHAIVEPVWRLEKALGFEQTHALFTLTGRSLVTLDGWLEDEPSPGILWAANEPDREPAEILHSGEVLRRLGWGHEVWEPDEVARRTGLFFLHRGLWMPGERVVDLQDLFADAPFPIVSPAKAASVDEHGDGVTVTLADGRRIEAEVVVLANGYDAHALHPFLADTLNPVREVAVRRPGPPGPATSVRTGFGWTTITRDDQGVVDLSGCRWASPHLETGEIDPYQAHPAVLERVLASGDRFCPALGDPIARWGWIEAHGCDNLPLVGPLPTSRRILVCTGFGANPIGFGFECGTEIALGLLEGKTTFIPACLDPARFLG